MRPGEYGSAISPVASAVGRQALHHPALSAVHHQHAAAGGQPQVRLHRPAHDAGGPKPVRERAHHLHANRLDHPGHGGGRGGPADLVASQYGTEYLPDAAADLPDQGQERPGGPRGDPAGRPSLRFARGAPRTAQPRRVQALRPDLEADRGQPDGRRPRPPHHDHRRGRRGGLPGQRQDDRVSRLSAGLRRRLRRSREPSWPTARSCCRRSRWARRSRCRELEPKSHTTQPPNRYSEASLTRALEEMGIGRPSTYASIIDTILARDYVFKVEARQRAGAHLDGLRRLAVAGSAPARPGRLPVHRRDGGRAGRHQPRRDRATSTTCGTSISATTHPGLKQQLQDKVDEIDARDVSRISHRQAARAQPEVFVRVGRYGPFLEQGDRRASLPEQDAARRTDARSGAGDARQGRPERRAAGHLPRDAASRSSSRSAASAPTCSAARPRTTRSRKTPRCSKGMKPEDVTLEVALEAACRCRGRLGEHPQSGEPVVAHNGRYGPYVKCGEETRSLPAGLSPLGRDAGAGPGAAGAAEGARRGARRRARSRSRSSSASPVTGKPVQLLAGPLRAVRDRRRDQRLAAARARRRRR